MTEGRRTAAFGGVAAALLVLAWISGPRVSSSAFSERGESLFPAFRDPNAASSLEVTEFDPKSATVHPFKVQNRGGRWTIPSQHDYPADAADRLAKTSAAIIALKKDDIATDNAVDFERFGVLDPLDTTAPNVQARGTRVSVRGTRGDLLADVIIGRDVEGHPGLRYVRLPTQKRVYVSNVGDLKLSTEFADWIERDVLEVDPSDIDAINLRNYALDRTSGRVNPGETMLLQQERNGNWTINGLGASERLDLTAVSRILEALASLRIAGVLPKPAGISATLRKEETRTAITGEDRADLARKGFYLANNGQLVSDRGEIVVRTVRGIYYTLRFGDIAPDSVSAAGSAGGAGENRYLFIMVNFDPGAARTAGRANEGAEKAQLLRTRFAPWYYIIGGDSIAALQVRRADLVKPAAKSQK
jgi:hypothetical protein